MTQSVQSIEIPLVDTHPSRPAQPFPADEEDLTGRVLSGRYLLLRQLGHGGMGSVYQGRHVTLERCFAIKILSRRCTSEKQAIQRFIREARATAQLHHENIVDVYDFGISQGRIYLVMEYLEGEDLAAVLRRDGPMPWHRVSRILLQVCAALQAAHRRRIVHRDIKPSNVFRVASDAGDDIIKVLDFGVAKVLDGGLDEGGVIETDAQLVVGTPEYMAPEGFAGGPVDGRVDVYAVGMLGYHLLTGKLPFLRSSAEFLQRVCAGVARAPGEVAPRRRIPAIADVIVMRALRPLAAERYQTIAELGAAIAAAVEPPTPPTPTPAFAPAPETVTELEVAFDDEVATTRREPQSGARLLPWRATLVSCGVALAVAATIDSISGPTPIATSAVAAPPEPPRPREVGAAIVSAPEDEDEPAMVEAEPIISIAPPSDAPFADAPVASDDPPAPERPRPASDGSGTPAGRRAVDRRARPASATRAAGPSPASATKVAEVPTSVPADPLWAPESAAPLLSDLLRPPAHEEVLR